MSLIILQILVLLPVVIDVMVSLLWIFNHREKDNDIGSPFVSVLIAARNEEENISSCLESLRVQDYERFEVLVGNDGSWDRTGAIAANFSKKDERIRVYDTEANAQAGGKANVLAQLSGYARGEVFFFTDADVKVPKSWIASMIKGFEENTGIVSGVTGIEGGGIWAGLQHLDWITAMGRIKVVSDLGFPVTAPGNNMAITRKAYQAAGGFEAIPFSVTEDFDILQRILAKGYTAHAIIDPLVYAVTAPEPKGMPLLHQRKRWMKGALQLPVIVVSILMAQALFLPSLVLLAVVFPVQALCLWLLKILVQSTFAHMVLVKVGKKAYLKELIWFEIYSGALSLMLPFFYILPIKIKWKGREY